MLLTVKNRYLLSVMDVFFEPLTIDLGVYSIISGREVISLFFQMTLTCLKFSDIPRSLK